MKKLFLLFSSIVCFWGAYSQNIQPSFFDSIAKYEKMMNHIGDSIIDGSNEWVRMDALTDFIPLFKRSLKFPGSYNYPFDSLRFMHKITAPDNSFKIYSWLLRFDNRTFRYYGAIQFNDVEKLKLVPLFDKSNTIPYDMEEDTILNNETWYGCLYYDIGITKKGKKKYYILLGWDGSNSIGNKKILEVMTFDKDSKPVFGAPIIKIDTFYKKDKTVILNRKVFQYNANAIFSLKFIPGTNVIAFDNLVAPDEKNKGKLWSYIPDGSYDYIEIGKGKLSYKKDLFKHVKIPPESLNHKGGE
jgi:hypothetical protein